MKDIFISYSHKDKTKVDHIVNQLQEKGYTVAYDENFSAGQKWDEKALEFILSTRCAIFFISENAMISEPILLELQAAEKEFKRSDYYYFAVLLDNNPLGDLYRALKKSDVILPSQLKIASMIYDLFPDSKLYINNDEYIIDRIVDSLDKNDILPSSPPIQRKSIIVDTARVDSYITKNYSLFSIEKEITIFPLYNEEKQAALDSKQYIDDGGSALYRLVLLPTDYINNPINSVHLLGLSFKDNYGKEFMTFKPDKTLDCNYSTNVLQRCYNCICIDLLTDKDIPYLFEKVKTTVLVLEINSIFNVSMQIKFEIEMNGKKDNSNNIDLTKIPEIITYNIHHTKYQVLKRFIKEN